MPSSSHSPNEIDGLNFEEVGIRWTVRQTNGERVRFHDLAGLQEGLELGTIAVDDELTFDGNVWRTLSDVPDLRAYFWQVWMRAQRGELQADWMPTIGDGIEEDAPTTIVLPDSELSQAIQEALTREMSRSREFILPPSVPDPGQVITQPVAEAAPEPSTVAHAPASPQPSDVPGILRAMITTLVLVSLALMTLLSMP